MRGYGDHNEARREAAGHERPIEITTRYATTVDELADAWAFVMERLEAVGPNPRITINPVTIMPISDMVDGLDGAPDREYQRQFEVIVSGMVHEATT